MRRSNTAVAPTRPADISYRRAVGCDGRRLRRVRGRYEKRDRREVIKDPVHRVEQRAIACTPLSGLDVAEQVGAVHRSASAGPQRFGGGARRRDRGLPATARRIERRRRALDRRAPIGGYVAAPPGEPLTHRQRHPDSRLTSRNGHSAADTRPGAVDRECDMGIATAITLQIPPGPGRWGWVRRMVARPPRHRCPHETATIAS